MNIVDAFKVFVKGLTGDDVSGNTIDEVIRAGADKCTNIDTLSASLTELSDLAAKYEDGSKKTIILNSSTVDSTKVFRISVTDDGTLSATEVVEESAEE